MVVKCVDIEKRGSLYDFYFTLDESKKTANPEWVKAVVTAAEQGDVAGVRTLCDRADCLIPHPDYVRQFSFSPDIRDDKGKLVRMATVEEMLVEAERAAIATAERAFPTKVELVK